MKTLGIAAVLGSLLLAASAQATPRLALLLVVDQLRRDRLDADLPGGLGRLAREGRVFARAELGHATAETCPGHVALATGRHPGAAGAGANYFVERTSGEVRYCLEDDPEAAAVIGAATPLGRSPRKLRFEALGDWMKHSDPASRVFSISAKDRSAIALGGLHPDGAYWLQRSGAIGFTTSRYYESALPRWVRDFNEGAFVDFLEALPERWVHRRGLQPPFGRRDDYPHELGDFSRTSGHPLRSDQVPADIEGVYVSPYADDLTLAFALDLVRKKGLGEGTAPDLLAVALSATDPIGHAYGPESHEAADALLRLDASIGSFLDALEAELGEGELIVVLSSDHGVLPIPEWLEDSGRATCPVPTGRIDRAKLRSRLDRHLYFEVGPWLPWPRSWLKHAGNQVTVDRARAAGDEAKIAEVVRAAEAWLEAQPGIEEAWTAQEISTRKGELARLYRGSYDPERSGDLTIQGAAGCLLSRYAQGTAHGAPYAYDRDVPLVFWGPGIAAGVSDGATYTVDVAPTLGRALGIQVPKGLDGRVLELDR